MQAVLISIQPGWCELIASGKKTVEVRKTMPLLPTPFKAYIYETFEQLGRIPANIVVPVGNGTLYIGVVKALEHLLASGVIDKFPQIIFLLHDAIILALFISFVKLSRKY